MTVEIVTQSSPELVEAMGRLIPQLSRTVPALTEEQVRDLVAQPGVYLFVFRPNKPAEDGIHHPILGMLTLATFTIPTGLRAWVEDVVVSSEARGQGAGRALVEAAVTHAQELGARTVDLTSRPSREAANRLYQRAGFELRETNVYRFSGK
ncbi:GNAT family N-acetyltransferase [Actinomyces radicidentis]|uniref:GNAT family N-acetyltransferase n=1 Tax=Actinomyces radicidentis TaxID=111015 RepID=UPI0026E068F7|nr:GNAT family N-acetyltransferase [Actinomyces radicidentis]